MDETGVKEVDASRVSIRIPLRLKQRLVAAAAARGDTPTGYARRLFVDAVEKLEIENG